MEQWLALCDHLTRAGAQVTYQEIPDLAHTYPREINPGVLSWLDGTNIAG